MQNENTKMKQTMSIKQTVSIGMFVAFMAIMSQFSIPNPITQIPLTLQTFAITLTGAFLGPRLGIWVMIMYIITGALGIPVFSNMRGGLHMLVSFTGGFMFGFPIMSGLAGYGTKDNNLFKGVFFALIGLAMLHVIGFLQFSVVANTSIPKAFMLSSMPYIIKDIISVVVGIWLGIEIKKRFESITA